MFSNLLKKKVKEEVVVHTFLTNIFDVVEAGFPEICDVINNSPEFVQSPNIKQDNYKEFLLVVLAGNLKRIPEYFDAPKDNRILDKCIEQLTYIFDKSYDDIFTLIKKYQSFISKVNFPSKNTLYGMSKAVFYKYELAQYQEEYFRNMNNPNPIFLKRINEVMENFMWNWDDFLEKYNVVD